MDNKAYLEKLYLENYSDMASFAARFFQNRDLAQDMVQETFLVAQVKIDQLRQSPSPRGWLFNTLKNVIGNTYKQQKRLRDMVPLEDCNAAEDFALPVEDQFGGLISQEELQILIWVYCEGWPYQEVARRLGISLDACKKRIQRARRRLKSALAETEERRSIYA